jgi:uncharacterized protein YbjT (DUF2867 family)
MNQEVFITGGTGYIGKRLIHILLHTGCRVKALVRKGSEHKLPKGCAYIVADPFDAVTFVHEIPPGCTFVQLLGVSRPSPKKKAFFRSIDLASARASALAAKQAGVRHFIYVSVAQTPTSVMREYQLCRAEGEAAILATGLKATFIRPWYIVGPGHYWPLLLQPVFKLLERIPATSAKARALRPVSLGKMLRAVIHAVKHPPADGVKVVEIDEIRTAVH